MELDLSGIEIKISRDDGIGYIVAIVVLIVILALGWLGEPYTMLAEDGKPKVLTFQDWRFLQAEQAYEDERQVLRQDVEHLVNLVNGQPNPVQVQLDVDEVLKHTQSGVPALDAARKSVTTAAMAVREWSVGTLDRDTALTALQDAVRSLGE